MTTDKDAVRIDKWLLRSFHADVANINSLQQSESEVNQSATNKSKSRIARESNSRRKQATNNRDIHENGHTPELLLSRETEFCNEDTESIVLDPEKGPIGINGSGWDCRKSTRSAQCFDINNNNQLPKCFENEVLSNSVDQSSDEAEAHAFIEAMKTLTRERKQARQKKNQCIEQHSYNKMKYHAELAQKLHVAESRAAMKQFAAIHSRAKSVTKRLKKDFVELATSAEVCA